MGRTIVYFAPSIARSKLVAQAMHRGILACGDLAEIRSSLTYRGQPVSDVALFYGLAEGCRRILADYKTAGKRAIYIDLGYWGRRNKSRWDGYHKLVLNSRHPTEYFQRIKHPSDRFDAFGVPIEPWRKAGRHIIVAGMSAKAASAEGLRPEQWERATIAQLRTITQRRIIYRPKPNWPGARPIPGAGFQPKLDLRVALQGAHIVVARHSNVAVDALLAGIPVYCPEGVASVLAESDLCSIETPCMPAGRDQWAADLAYCQYSMDEMADGTAWRALRREGLVR